MEYGDTTISKETCGEFQGTQTAAPVVVPKVPYDAVRSEDVPLAILYRKLKASAPGEKEAIQQKIKDILELRERVDLTMKDIVAFASRDLHQSNRILNARYRLTAFDCYVPVVELFDERCFDISQNDYAARRLFLLVNLCEEQVHVETILESVAKVCKQN
jgi:hypothetical protein